MIPAFLGLLGGLFSSAAAGVAATSGAVLAGGALTAAAGGIAAATAGAVASLTAGEIAAILAGTALAGLASSGAAVVATGFTAAQIAALIATGAYLICKKWPEVVKWASALIPELKRFLTEEPLVRGMESAITFFGEKINNEKALIKCRTFLHDRERDKWFEKAGITEISASAVPPHIRNRMAREKDPDITHEMELETRTSV